MVTIEKKIPFIISCSLPNSSNNMRTKNIKTKHSFSFSFFFFSNVAFPPSILHEKILSEYVLRIEPRSWRIRSQCSTTVLATHTVNVLPVFITVLISVNLQPRKVLVIFTAFPSTLTLSVKLGVQAKPVYITGKLTLLTNSYYCFFQWLLLLMACNSYQSFSSKFSWLIPWNVTI